MKIPKYWAKAVYDTQTEEEEPLSFSCWHWSDISIEDARGYAQERVRRIAANFINGQHLNRYSYGDRPIREEVVDRLKNGQREVGVVTRNAYGSLVLNAAGAMFVDIDFKKKPVGGSLGGLFNRTPPPPPEAEYLPAIEQWVRRHPGLGVRVYRTAAGLRCLVITDTFDPADRSTQAMMESLGGDPLYIRLCHHQESFRARLTPKHWRCNIDAPPSRYPWESAMAEQVYRNWERMYAQVSSGYAVCRLVAEYGDYRVHPDVMPILTLHDRACNVQSTLELA
jgi:hypothetical protein